jgi:hypothetical protein
MRIRRGRSLGNIGSDVYNNWTILTEDEDMMWNSSGTSGEMARFRREILELF